MTRQLLIMRHCEAGVTPPGGTDRDRPLSAYGRAQAAEIGRLIAAGRLPEPQVVFTSVANRTMETWALAAEASGLVVTAFAERILYGAGQDELADLVAQLDDGRECVAIVGHAPEIPALARSVRDGRTGPQPLVGWPAGCVGVLEIDGGWDSFPDAARLVAVLAVEPPDED